MNDNITKQYAINAETLDKVHYMEAILQEALRLNLFTDKELEKIQIQLVGFLSSQVQRYTHGDSSSVRVEIAKSIMQSVYYSIGTYLKSLSDIDECLKLLKNTDLSELFANGQKMINSQVVKTKLSLSLMKKNCINTDNIAYNGTINTVLPGFFKMYNIEFGAYETSALIDYPLCLDKMDTVGIEYISSYIKKLTIENDFCNRFSEDSIKNLLHSYHVKSKDLLINIFQLILTNSLARVLLNKSADELNISALECEKLQQKLSAMKKDELDRTILNAKIELLEELKITKPALQEYINEAFYEIVTRLTSAIKNNQLSAVFIVHKEIENDLIKFKDSAQMDDDLFRKVIEDITDCDTASDKLAVIKREVHSFGDLHDILCADCIFDDEYVEILRSLEDIELALLYKKISPEGSDKPKDDEDYNLSSSEKEWQTYFNSYFNSLEKNRRQNIIALSNKIDFQ